MTGVWAAARIADTGDWNAVDLEVTGFGTDDLASMRGRVAEPDDVAHGWALVAVFEEISATFELVLWQVHC